MNPYPDSPTIKIGVIDDQQVFTEGISRVLEKLPGLKVILQAKSGKDLVNQLKIMPELPDVLLMDVNMPDMDGIEATRHVTSTYPSIKVVALTMHNELRIFTKMVKAGCCAYLNKAVEVEKIENTIRTVHQREKRYAHKVILEGEIHSTSSDEIEESFSETEIKLIELISQGLSNQQIAQKILLSINTVEHLKTDIFKKLRVKTALTMVMEALRRKIIKV